MKKQEEGWWEARPAKQTRGPGQSGKMPVNVCRIRESLREGILGYWMGSKEGS